VSPRRAGFLLLLTVGVFGGSRRDRPDPRPPTWSGGYRVLAADFHVHAFLGDGYLWSWDLVLEARRRGLDALAVTNHNQLLAARLARAFATRIDGPVVLLGEEITAPGFHLIGAGLQGTVDWRGTAAEAITEVHRQGGVAIAAHPFPGYASAYSAEALRTLDGTEAIPAGGCVSPWRAGAMRAFYGRAKAMNPRLAAIGSSDYHGFGGPGMGRTYVFAREKSEAAVLEAVRAGRTVVVDAQGNAEGDPEMVRLGGWPAPRSTHRSLPDRLEAGCAWLGLFGLLFLGPHSGPKGAARTTVNNGFSMT
jgi:hypothetical protein